MTTKIEDIAREIEDLIASAEDEQRIAREKVIRFRAALAALKAPAVAVERNTPTTPADPKPDSRAKLIAAIANDGTARGLAARAGLGHYAYRHQIQNLLRDGVVIMSGNRAGAAYRRVYFA